MPAAVMVLSLALAPGCTAERLSPPRASLDRLRERAVYDTDCPSQMLRVHPIDTRATAVFGCNVRLVYIESCETRRGRERCTWQLDGRSSAAGARGRKCYDHPAISTADPMLDQRR